MKNKILLTVFLFINTFVLFSCQFSYDSQKMTLKTPEEICLSMNMQNKDTLTLLESKTIRVDEPREKQITVFLKSEKYPQADIQVKESWSNRNYFSVWTHSIKSNYYSFVYEKEYEKELKDDIDRYFENFEGLEYKVIPTVLPQDLFLNLDNYLKLNDDFAVSGVVAIKPFIDSEDVTDSIKFRIRALEMKSNYSNIEDSRIITFYLIPDASFDLETLDYTSVIENKVLASYESIELLFY